MKKTLRVLALLVALVSVLSVCCTALAADLYPDLQHLISLYGEEAGREKYHQYVEQYTKYMQQHGDPTRNPESLNTYKKYLQDNGFTSLEGYYYNNQTNYYYGPYYDPYYNPYYNNAPAYNPYAYAAPAPVVEQPYISYNRAPQNEYEIKFMTGESSVSGNRLVYKTRTLDDTEIKRSKIYVTSATVTVSGGESITWNFVASGETVSAAGKIARLEVVFGKSAQATLTVHESNGTVDKEVNCSQRTVSAAGGSATVLGVIAYDLSGNIVTAYDASGAECDPSTLR